MPGTVTAAAECRVTVAAAAAELHGQSVRDLDSPAGLPGGPAAGLRDPGDRPSQARPRPTGGSLTGWAAGHRAVNLARQSGRARPVFRVGPCRGH